MYTYTRTHPYFCFWVGWDDMFPRLAKGQLPVSWWLKKWLRELGLATCRTNAGNRTTFISATLASGGGFRKLKPGKAWEQEPVCCIGSKNFKKLMTPVVHCTLNMLSTKQLQHWIDAGPFQPSFVAKPALGKVVLPKRHMSKPKNVRMSVWATGSTYTANPLWWAASLKWLWFSCLQFCTQVLTES